MIAPKLNGWQPDAYSKEYDPKQDYKFLENASKFFILNSLSNSNVIDLRKWCSPIENQQQLGSCVGNAVVGALELLQIKHGIPYKDLSRLFVYYNARLMTQSQHKDEGCHIYLAFGTLSSLGTCTEQKWPYDIKQVFNRPSWGCYREAFVNKIDSYYSITGNSDTINSQIVSALKSGNPVVFGMEVDNNYLNYSSGIVKLEKSNFRSIGRHAQLIVGCDLGQKTFIVRNSWGTSWGDKGYAYLPMNEIHIVANAQNFWVPLETARNFVNP